MTESEVLQYQSKTISTLSREVIHLEKMYYNLKELSVNTIKKLNEINYQLRKENEILRKVLAG